MPKPKLLTPEEVAEIEAFTHRDFIHAGNWGKGETIDITGRIELLITDWKEMRRLLVELTAGPGAGLGDDDEWYCIYCLKRRPRPPEHAPDCPIVRGREMVWMP